MLTSRRGLENFSSAPENSSLSALGRNRARARERDGLSFRPPSAVVAKITGTKINRSRCFARDLESRTKARSTVARDFLS